MKTLFYLPVLLLIAALLVIGCESHPENPGDFSVKCTLELTPVVKSLRGVEYPLTQMRSIDSTYRYFYIEEDTLKDASGEPVIDDDGNLIITEDTIYYNSKVTARFTEYALVVLPWEMDTFEISFKSNALWSANVPITNSRTESTWFYNYNSTTAGGGDGSVLFRTKNNTSGRMRGIDAVQEIYSRDSTVMARLHFNQTFKPAE